MNDIPTTYIYKIGRAGVFLGVLPNVTSEFEYAQDINSASVMLEVSCNISADVAAQPLDPLRDETGDILLDETGGILYPERVSDVVGSFSPLALIRENNDLNVYEVSSNYPNGKLVFSGFIETWEASLGGDSNDSDKIDFTAVSNGIDLVDYLVEGSPYLSDQSQTSQNAQIPVLDYPQQLVGQSFTIGVGVSNLASIDVMLRNDATTDATITLYLLPAPISTGLGTPLATIAKVIPASTGNIIYRFVFDTAQATTPGQQMFFYLKSNLPYHASLSVKARYQNTDVYAGGDNINGTGVSPFGWFPTSNDLYFVTYSSAGNTTVAFSTQDPATMLQTTIDTYHSQGGNVDYDTGTIDLTGVSVAYTFNVATVLEGIQKFLELAPSDFYWYVNPATQILYFKQTSTTPTHRFTKGKHVKDLKIKGTIEGVKNAVYFSGGDTGGGVNLFSYYFNQDSLDTVGRKRLERLSDNRVTIQNTADTIAESFLAQHAYIAYSSPLTILAKDYDITTINVGDTVKINGYGNFLDFLILQVARVTRRTDEIDLIIGILLDRQGDKLTQALRDLDKLQTVDNPAVPS